MSVDDLWTDQKDDVFNVVADIDPPSAQIEYAYKAGYQAAGARPADDIRIVSGAEWRQRAERAEAALAYLKTVTQEVADGETSRSALRIALAQVDSEEWWQAQGA